MTTPVSFELAKTLKEYGFNESCSDYYVPIGKLYSNGWGDEIYQSGFNSSPEPLMTFNYDDFSKKQKESLYLCPTIADVVMWLFNEHAIWVSVLNIDKLHKLWEFQVSKEGIGFIYSSGQYPAKYDDSIEKSYEAGINYSLKHIIETNKK